MRVLGIIGLVLFILLIIVIQAVVVMVLYSSYIVSGWGGVWLMIVVLYIMLK